MPEEAGERRRAEPGQPGLLQRLQQREPIRGDGSAEDARRAGDHRGNADGGERRAGHRTLVVGAHEHRDVSGAHRLAVDRGRAAQQARHIRGQIAGDELPRGPDDRQIPPRRARQAHPGGDPDPHRRVRGRPDQPSPRRGRLHPVDDDALVTERGAVEHRVQGGEQGRIAAVVDRERRVVVGGARGVEVGDDVGPAERVDGLLRIADQHQRGVAVEGAAQDGPLDGVGVLELVDQHDPVARSQPPGRAR